MISLPENTRIYLALEPINMHRSFDGLALLVKDVIELNPLSGHLFVFRNKRGDKIKCLIWDRNGFAIGYKRIERGRFRFPKGTCSRVEINADDLKLLLDGIDISKLKRFPTLEYEYVV